MAAPAQIPNMKVMTVTTLEQNFRIHSRLNHARRTPLAGDHGVVTQMPEEVVVKILGTALDLPLAEDIKTLRIEDEDTARAFAIGRSQGADEDAVRTAMDRMRAAISR